MRSVGSLGLNQDSKTVLMRKREPGASLPMETKNTINPLTGPDTKLVSRALILKGTNGLECSGAAIWRLRRIITRKLITMQAFEPGKLTRILKQKGNGRRKPRLTNAGSKRNRMKLAIALRRSCINTTGSLKRLRNQSNLIAKLRSGMRRVGRTAGAVRTKRIQDLKAYFPVITVEHQNKIGNECS